MKLTFLGAADALRSRTQDELGLQVRVHQHGDTVDLSVEL